MPILSFLRVKPSCGLQFSRAITFFVRFTIPEEIEGTTSSLPQHDFSRGIAYFIRSTKPEEIEGTSRG